MSKVTQIQEKVAEFYGIPFAEMLSKKRDKTTSRARHVAMYLVRNYTDMSLPEIARAFRRQDHTTVLHAVRKVRKQVDEDENFSNAMWKLRLLINRQVT